MRYKRTIKIMIYALFTLFIGYMLLLYMLDRPVPDTLSQEDGMLEWTTVIFYIFASIIFFLAAIIFMYTYKQKRFHSMWDLGLSVLCFIIAGEEISWGQRILKLATSEYLKNIKTQRWLRQAIVKS